MVKQVEIDGEGRIKLPEELRDALHLLPGKRLTLDSQGSYILLQTRPPGVYLEKGMPVYDHGRPLPPDHVDWVDRDREERGAQLMDEWPSK
jgi:bifunctional DNA-binding transcriptional regulator/antitoxin component of YhaV-PrlF toxin-antitoxin module